MAEKSTVNNSNYDYPSFEYEGQTPNIYVPVKDFRYWVQTVLPQAYDDALSYQELLGRLVAYLNALNKNNEGIEDDIKTLIKNFNDLASYVNSAQTSTENYINNYFNNLDITTEINNKLAEYLANGTLADLVNQGLADGLNEVETSIRNDLNEYVTDGSFKNEVLTSLFNSTKYAIWIGDSFVEANSLGNDKNKRFSTRVSNRLGLNELNYANGGSGFFPIEGKTDFLQQAQNAVADVTSKGIDVRLVPYIFICGGGNDQDKNPNKNRGEYLERITQIVNTLKAKFTYSQIIIIPMYLGWNWISRKAYMHYQYVENSAALVATVFPNAYTILCGIKKYILADGVHPNVSGHELVATWIYNKLTFGHYNQQFFALTTNHANVTDDGSYLEIKDDTSLFIKIKFTVTDDVPSNLRIPIHGFGGAQDYRPYIPYPLRFVMKNQTNGDDYLCFIQWVDGNNQSELQVVCDRIRAANVGTEGNPGGKSDGWIKPGQYEYYGCIDYGHY